MVRQFKPLTRPTDEVIVNSDNVLGYGSYGVAYGAHILRNGKVIRKIAVKLMHSQPLDNKLHPTHEKYPVFIKGYQLWFEQIPAFQKKFPRLVFNNQQLLPTKQIKITSLNRAIPLKTIHKFAIASELYRRGSKGAKWPMAYRLADYSDSDLKVEDLNQLEDFIHECTRQRIPIHLDMFEVITSGSTKRIVVRDPDFPAYRLLNMDAQPHVNNALNVIHEYTKRLRVSSQR